MTNASLNPRLNEARGHLANAQYLAGGDRDDQVRSIAQTLTGLLSLAIALADTETAEDNLRRLYDEADDALGRVLVVADDLAKEGRTALKPAAFPDLAKRIQDAVYGVSLDAEEPEVT